MKTRSRKNDQENHPALFEAKVSQKSTKSKIHPESPPELGGSNMKKRFALKDNTNLNRLEVVCVKRSIKEEHSKKEVSGKNDLIPEKVPHQSTVTPKQYDLGSNSFCNYSDPQPDRVSNARRCVYMNTIPEEEEMNDKECMYEFVVDKNEPPSRRRKKRSNKKIMNKPKGYPRKRVNSISEESSVASSVVTSSFASSVNTSFGRNLSPKEAFIKKNEHPAETSVVSSNCQENISSSPVESIVTLTKSSTVVSSDRLTLVSAYNDPSSVTSFTTKIPTGESCVIQHKRTSSIPRASDDPNAVEPPITPNKSSLCNSSLWSEGQSVCLTMAKHHSTPCKSRSGSDSSSYLQLCEQVANKENCFGFSSDEDEENVNNLPSPVHLSPHSRVHRQGLLSPHNAPSRFAPEVVKKALALKAVTKPLDFGSSKDSQAQRKLKVAENKKGKRVKLAERCSKRTKVGKEACVVSKAKLSCDASSRITGDDKLRDASCPSAKPDLESLTPLTECLFEDLEGKDDQFLKITPIRRSYGKPLQQKTRRVVGGGLCLESGDEDDLVMELDKKNSDETERLLKGKGSPKLHKKRNKNNTEKKEKEMDAWASLMKSQFEEVDDFDLCVDRE